MIVYLQYYRYVSLWPCTGEWGGPAHGGGCRRQAACRTEETVTALHILPSNHRYGDTLLTVRLSLTSSHFGGNDKWKRQDFFTFSLWYFWYFSYYDTVYKYVYIYLYTYTYIYIYLFFIFFKINKIKKIEEREKQPEEQQPAIQPAARDRCF